MYGNIKKIYNTNWLTLTPTYRIGISPTRRENDERLSEDTRIRALQYCFSASIPNSERINEIVQFAKGMKVLYEIYDDINTVWTVVSGWNSPKAWISLFKNVNSKLTNLKSDGSNTETLAFEEEEAKMELHMQEDGSYPTAGDIESPVKISKVGEYTALYIWLAQNDIKDLLECVYTAKYESCHKAKSVYAPWEGIV